MSSRNKGMKDGKQLRLSRKLHIGGPFPGFHLLPSYNSLSGLYFQLVRASFFFFSLFFSLSLLVKPATHSLGAIAITDRPASLLST